MAVVLADNGLYHGLSSDTKPTAPAGYRFYETDIYDTHVSDGTHWWLVPNHNPYSPRRWGYLPWGTSLTVGLGMTSLLAASTGAGTQVFANDATNGRYVTCSTGASALNKGGYRISGANTTRRGYNGRARFRFQVPTSGDYTTARLYIGLATNGFEPTGDDAYTTNTGVLVGFISGGTHFKIIHNDGTGSTVIEDLTTPVTLDTAIHTVSIVGDEANSKYAVKWDSQAYKDITTDIPSSTNTSAPIWQNETVNAADPKAFRMYNMFCQADK
jgi:hypothetical protein